MSTTPSLVTRAHPEDDHLPAEHLAVVRDAVCGSPWLLEVLDAVASLPLPDVWVGAGAVRAVVWNALVNEQIDVAKLRDLDVVFFDPGGPVGDDRLAEQLARRLGVECDVTNEAMVHRSYPAWFGREIEPFASMHDAVASWPEPCSCVAVRREGSRLRVCAPLGLTDLIGQCWRPNLAWVTEEHSRQRFESKRIRQRWPAVTFG